MSRRALKNLGLGLSVLCLLLLLIAAERYQANAAAVAAQNQANQAAPLGLNAPFGFPPPPDEPLPGGNSPFAGKVAPGIPPLSFLAAAGALLSAAGAAACFVRARKRTSPRST